MPPNFDQTLRLELPYALTPAALAFYEAGGMKGIEMLRDGLARDPRAFGKARDR